MAGPRYPSVLDFIGGRSRPYIPWKPASNRRRLWQPSAISVAKAHSLETASRTHTVVPVDAGIQTFREFAPSL